MPSQICVWIIDDVEEVRMSLSMAIEGTENIRCTGSYTSADEALEALRRGAAAPDVFLLDILMPGTSGVDAVVPIRQIVPNAKILFLTGSENKEHIHRAIERGASGYVLKPLKPQTLFDAIHAAATGTMPLDPLVAKTMVDSFHLQSGPGADYGLTPAEKEIVRTAMKGGSKDQIASELHLSVHTVKTHCKNIFWKLRVHTVQEMVAKSILERLA